MLCSQLYGKLCFTLCFMGSYALLSALWEAMLHSPLNLKLTSRGNDFPFMLNSTEYEIDTADNCKIPTVTIVNILTFISRINALLGEY